MLKDIQNFFTSDHLVPNFLREQMIIPDYLYNQNWKILGILSILIVIFIIIILAIVGAFNKKPEPSITTTPPPPPPLTTPPVKKYRYIQLYQTQPTQLNISEIQVYEPNSTVNLLQRNSVTIGEINNAASHGLYPYEKMIDGDPSTFGAIGDGQINTPIIIEIDLGLGNSKEIGRIIVINRIDCCRLRIVGSVIRLLDENHNVMYTSNKFQAVDGSVVYPGITAEIQDLNSGFLNSYPYYTLTPPSPIVIASRTL